MHNSDQTLQRFVERARRLYSLPAVAVKVLDLTGHPQVDIRALKDCIENDPALTTKVLRVVNSSLFGLSREVSDLNQALALLGTKPLKLLVLGFSLSEAVFTKFTGKIMVRYWRHTLTKAVAAREIAESVCHIPGDEPFIAALLQDIGMLVLLQEMGEPYARLLSRPYSSQGDLARLEIEAFGFEHTELTARLLANWGLGESLQNAVRLNQAQARPATTDHSPSGALPRILNLAQLLADLLIDDRHDLLANLMDTPLPPGCLTPPQLCDLVGRLQDKVAQLAEVFSLELPPGLDYRDVLVQAHARMSEVAAELATETVKRNRPVEPPICQTAAMLDEVQALSAAVSQFIQRPSTTSTITETKRVEVRQPAVAAPHAPAPRVVDLSPQRLMSAASSLKIEGEAGLLNRLALVAYACRQSRWALSLALVEVDHFPELVLKQGPQQAARLARVVHDVCRGIDMPQTSCVPMRQYSFAIAVPDCDRHQATQLFNQLVQEVRHIAPGEGARAALSVSVGLACADVLPKNFSHQALYESAARCLSTAQLSGGNTLKSIGI